jgi:hypothetical protein
MIHKYIIIPKSKKDEANVFCNSIGAEGDTFEVPLYKNGEHTHYWTGWLMTPEQYAELATKYTTHFDTYMEALEVTGLEVKSGDDE